MRVTATCGSVDPRVIRLSNGLRGGAMSPPLAADSVVKGDPALCPEWAQSHWGIKIGGRGLRRMRSEGTCHTPLLDARPILAGDALDLLIASLRSPFVDPAYNEPWIVAT